MIKRESETRTVVKYVRQVLRFLPQYMKWPIWAFALFALSFYRNRKYVGGSLIAGSIGAYLLGGLPAHPMAYIVVILIGILYAAMIP